MAWEVWQRQASFYPENDNKHVTYLVGFFCNTADVSFGPVCHFDVSMDYLDAVEEIYDSWETADPRSLNNDQIYDELQRIMKEA